MNDRVASTAKDPSVEESVALADELRRVVQSAQLSRGARGVLLGTSDREQAFAIVEDVAASCNVNLVHITPTSVRQFDAIRLTWAPPRTVDRSPSEMISHAREQVGDRKPRIVIFEEIVRTLRDDSQHLGARIALSDLLAATDLPAGLVMVFVDGPQAEAQLPSMISAQIVKLQVGYPRTAELDQIVRSEVAAIAQGAGVTLDVGEIRREARPLAEGLVGLTRKAARDLLRDSLARDASGFEQARHYLQEQKRRRLSHELAMEVLDASSADQPAGVENLMRHVEVQKPRMRVYGKERARGVVLIGPPGTGKTMMARAIGHITGLPVVVVRIPQLMNSLLGETEARFMRLFRTVEAMAPCVLFIDEIEKAFGDSGERDGGTMMRVTGSLLSWLSDNLYPNYVVATCNSLTRMGEVGLTMTRSERFDAAYFVDVPNEKARVAILRPLLEGRLPGAASCSVELAAKTDKFSGADLFSVVKHATAMAAHERRDLSMHHLLAEVSRKRSRANALYEEFQPLRTWAIRFCEPASDPD